MRSVAVITVLGALVAFAAASPGSPSLVRGDRAVGERCPVTLPTRAVTPEGSLGPDAFNHGSARLRVNLWPGGVLRAGVLPDGGSFATVGRDGSIHAKVGWWVRDGAKLVIVGKRLDRAAPPLRARVPAGYGAGFQPTGLTFPTVGCWRVTGKAGTARLTFVVRVTKLR